MNSEDNSLYDIAQDRPTDPPIAGHQNPAPPPPAPVLPYRGPTRGQPKVDVEAVRNQWMPLWLLGGGVAIEVIAAFVHGPHVRAALTEIATGLLLGTAVMLGGVLIAARIREIQLGHFGYAVLKLAAVCVAPSAAATLLSPVLQYIPIIGGLTVWVIQFILYFALLGALFELDESDTWYCVAVIFIVGVATHFASMAILAKL